MNIGHVQKYIIINCSYRINVLVLIRPYWWENWSKINKRTGRFIRNSRVCVCAVFKNEYEKKGFFVQRLHTLKITLCP